MDTVTAQKLIDTLLEDRKKQQEAQDRTNQLLLQAIAAINNTSQTPGPTTLAVPHHVHKTARLTAEALVKNEDGPVDVDSFQTNSLFTNDDDRTDADDDESWYVQEPLQPEEYDEAGLKRHILEYEWTPSDIACLEDVADPKKQRELFKKDQITIFPTELETSSDKSHLTHYEIFNVGPDGAPMQILPSAGSEKVSRSLSIWERIRTTNKDATRQKAVGRITIVREPSPLLFAALHYTHHKHFDVDELWGFLVSDDPVLVRAPNAFSDYDTHQRSFSITFEFYTLVEEGCEPMSWQKAKLETSDTQQRSHIAITRCSSVVSLSLEGKPMGHVKNKLRRAKKRIGNVFNPFAPWRVLNVQCYADTRSSLDAHDSTKHYVNGPEAFLVTLCAEYKDAVKRLTAIYKAVTDLVQPPMNFMFSLTTRDKLLFEDDDFTYSRMYFWAFNTLGIMNEDIEDMQTCYYEAFKDSVWEGTDKIIWPGSSDTTASAKHVNWRKRMSQLRDEIEEQMDRLREMHKLNQERAKYIKNLHNGLFNGTSVLESRRSVENAITTVKQGRNIKLLTLVTIFFLPLTFVTSVFGMTMIEGDRRFYHFAWTIVAICAPTYILIGSLNTESGMGWWQRQVKRLVKSLASLAHALAWFLALFHYKPKWTKNYHDRERRRPTKKSPGFTDVRWDQPKPRERRPRHMSNDMPEHRGSLAHRDTFGGMPDLKQYPTTIEEEKMNGIGNHLERTDSRDQTIAGEREPKTPTESFSFKPKRLGVGSSNTGSPPPHRASIGVVALPGQYLPPQQFNPDRELEMARRRGTMMTIASERTLEQREKDEDAISFGGSSTGSKDSKRSSFFSKVLSRRKKRKDDVP